MTDTGNRLAGGRAGRGPGEPQSLSPFESRATTLAVLSTVLIISTMILLVCWVFWV